MRSVIIMYGSSGGNTELVCEKIYELLKEKNVSMTLQRIERSQVTDIFKADMCILAAPTYEHGVIQHHFIPFLKELKKFDLKGRELAVVGLGDPLYDDHYHIESANILEKAIKSSNGKLFTHSLRISKNPLPQLETRVKIWADNLAKLLSSTK